MDDDRDYAEESYWRGVCPGCDRTGCEGYCEVSNCPACGEPPDYCQGHGEFGDLYGYLILADHDEGDHGACHADSECVQ